LWSQVKHTGQINILAFPCNQFGAQEPDTNENILEFAHGYDVDFSMMDKIDVNGANASLVYKYLKAKAGPAIIAWNFATYFVVAPDGTIESHSGIEPLELKDEALGLLESDEL
jgi:glutathione peroxidase